MSPTANFTPLKWPNEHLEKARQDFWCVGEYKYWKTIQKLVEDRGAIPPEVWGSDPRRQEVGRTISLIIKDKIRWPTDNFIPDDSLALLCWGGGFDGVEIEAMMAVEEEFSFDIPEDIGFMLGEITLGQLVDYVLAHGICPQPWPKEGTGSLESQFCSCLTTFLDIRKFIQEHCQMTVPKLRPSTPIRQFVDDRDLPKLRNYVQKRFGAGPIYQRKLLRILPPFWSWVVICAVGVTAAWQNIPWPFMRWIVSLVVLITFAVLVAKSTRPVWPRNVRTVGDLIKWILAQRASETTSVK